MKKAITLELEDAILTSKEALSRREDAYEENDLCAEDARLLFNELSNLVDVAERVMGALS